MNKQYVLCLLVAFATNSFAADGWVSVNKKHRTSKRQYSKSQHNSASNSLVNDLLNQVQMMQQEMSELRGMIEQQENKVRILERKQKSAYQDVDKRLQAIAKKSAQSSAHTTASSSSKKNSKTISYKEAMQLVREKKYTQAITAFEQFYKANPNSSLAPNALYWKGEIQMVKGSLKQAKSSFFQVTKHFPTHSKSVDASYKLAVIKHRQGDIKGAKRDLQRLIKKHSGKSTRTVRLAKSYLKRL